LDLNVGLGLRRFDSRRKRKFSRNAARDPPVLKFGDGRFEAVPARFVVPGDGARAKLDSRDVQAHRAALAAPAWARPAHFRPPPTRSSKLVFPPLCCTRSRVRPESVTRSTTTCFENKAGAPAIFSLVRRGRRSCYYRARQGHLSDGDAGCSERRSGRDCLRSRACARLVLHRRDEFRACTCWDRKSRRRWRSRPRSARRCRRRRTAGS